ncbi:MAG: hypothetical protein KBS82_05270 [Oscillospiraceae bacterium]|nr:hypothetical protein [Candidatus Limimonas egerieequi]
MIKHLYNSFAHWYRGGTIYFYSDPHFSDDEMKYIRKNYIGDDEQVHAINKKVGKNDTIIFLGDIGNVEFIRKIRGYKILIMGNHDSGSSNYIRTLDENNMDNHLFDEVYEGPLCVSEKIILSHEPIDIPFMLNIHGHDHSNWTFQDNNHWNVCAENIGYTPISIKEIIKSGCLKNIDSIHRVTIDRAIDKKQNKK